MPRAVLGECGCMSSPWVGLSLAGWQFTQRGCMITLSRDPSRLAITFFVQ